MYQLARSTRDKYGCAICGAVVKEKGADKNRGDLGKVSRTHVSCGEVRRCISPVTPVQNQKENRPGVSSETTIERTTESASACHVVVFSLSDGQKIV